jgi:hypothetical protein
MAKRQSDPPGGQGTQPEQAPHHETLIEEIAEDLESRFLAAAQVATSTSSPEVNLATAALAGLEDELRTEPAEPGSEAADQGRRRKAKRGQRKS